MVRIVSTVYPQDSDFGDTDAKVSIWENKADFNQKAEALAQFSAKLASLIEQGEQKKVPELMREVSQPCKIAINTIEKNKLF